MSRSVSRSARRRSARRRRHSFTALGAELGKPERKGTRLVVAGHTDARGGDDFNQRLSERRAAAVKHVLVTRFGMPDETVVAVGHGKAAAEERRRSLRRREPAGRDFGRPEQRTSAQRRGAALTHGGRPQLSHATDPRGQRRHHPRRQGADRAPRPAAGGRALHAARRRRRGRREPRRGGRARGDGGDRLAVEPVALAGYREAIVRDGDGRIERHFVILPFAARWIAGEPVLNEELSEAAWRLPSELTGLEHHPGARRDHRRGLRADRRGRMIPSP